MTLEVSLPLEHQRCRSVRLKLRSRTGCTECKIRKCKCDETKPECGQCRKSNRECRYLSTTTPFENKLLDLRKSQSKKIELPQHDISQFRDEMSLVCLSGDHSNIRISHMLQTRFRGANAACTGAGQNALTVHSELHFANDTGSLTWNSLNAMAMVSWGIKNRDQKILSAGFKARSTVLNRLKDSLARDTSLMTGDVVAAISLARLFETMLPQTQKQWMVHAQGMASVFAKLGPKAFRTPDMRRLIENNRWVIIMVSSVLRQPTMLNSKAWKTIPWEGVEKDGLQRLLDIYAEVPSMHAMWDDWAAAKNDKQLQGSKAVGVVTQLRSILLELHSWRASVDEDIEASVHIWSGKPSEISCPWTQPLAFNTLHHAYAIAMYNMIIVVLSRYLAVFPDAGNVVAGPSHHSTSSNATLLHNASLPLGPVYHTVEIAANEIAAMVPWIMQDSSKDAGAMYMAGPLRVCDEYYWKYVDPVKSEWASQTLELIDSTWNSLTFLINQNEA